MRALEDRCGLMHAPNQLLCPSLERSGALASSPSGRDRTSGGTRPERER